MRVAWTFAVVSFICLGSLALQSLHVDQICLQSNEVGEFVKSLQAVPKSGRHNPLKKPERYAKGMHKLVWLQFTSLAASFNG